jgi:regulator of protease activity HflC (stomatin/prohibitin superfamily)
MPSYEDEMVGTIKKALKIGLTVVLVILAISMIFGSFYTIQSGQEGVLLTFNKAAPSGIQPGLHFKVPVVQKIIKFDVKTQKYETGAAAASKDLQDVSANVAVNYHLAAGTTPQVFSEMGVHYEERVIQPAVQEVVKAVTAKFTAEELITRRAEVSNDIFLTLRDRLQSRGLFVENIAITNFQFSSSFTAAIEAKVTAEQASLEQKNLLEKVKYEAAQRVTNAEGQRDSTIAIATGEAESTRLNAQAEATKVGLIQAQLEKSPQYVDWVKATRWDGSLPNFYMTGSSNPLIMSLPEFTSSN